MSQSGTGGTERLFAPGHIGDLTQVASSWSDIQPECRSGRKGTTRSAPAHRCGPVQAAVRRAGRPTPGVHYRRWRTVAFGGYGSLSVPDHGRNWSWLGRVQRRFGPGARLILVTLCETGTRGLVGAVFGPATKGEADYAHDLVDHLTADMLPSRSCPTWSVGPYRPVPGPASAQEHRRNGSAGVHNQAGVESLVGRLPARHPVRAFLHSGSGRRRQAPRAPPYACPVAQVAAGAARRVVDGYGTAGPRCHQPAEQDRCRSRPGLRAPARCSG